MMKYILYVLIGLSLSGCGYRPLYATNSAGQGVANQLSGIAIAEVDTRPAQMVRNNLLSGIRPAGTATEDRYKLVLIPLVIDNVVVDQNRPGMNRHRLRFNMEYTLTDLRNGNQVTRGKTFSNVSYDEIHQPVADMQAQNNATERAAIEVAGDIRTRLAAFLATRS